MYRLLLRANWSLGNLATSSTLSHPVAFSLLNHVSSLPDHAYLYPTAAVMDRVVTERNATVHFANIKQLSSAVEDESAPSTFIPELAVQKWLWYQVRRQSLQDALILG